MLGAGRKSARALLWSDAPVTPVNVIVGLGNPGRAYANNRHNMGFKVVDELARRAGVAFSAKGSGSLLTASANVVGRAVTLVKPQSFMNASGEAISPYLRYFHLTPEQMLVVHDDLDLPLGRLRFRRGGSSGGQNGVSDIMRHWPNSEFIRLKAGISRPPAGWQVRHWVLSDFPPDEAKIVEVVIKYAVDAVMTLLAEGFDAAQNLTNGLDLRPAPPEAEPPLP